MTHRDKEKLENYLERVWKEANDPISDTKINASWKSFESRISGKQKKKTSIYAQIASVAVVLSVIIVSYHFVVKHTSLVTLVNHTKLPLRETLQDGTQVVLGVGSSLEYPVSFATSSRNVTLKGEAFFDVAEDSTKPFRVTAGKTITTVFGTSFNIVLDTISKDTRISLFTGLVKVKITNRNDSWDIKPGEEFQLQNSAPSVVKFNRQEVSAWRLPSYSFIDEPLTRVFKVLEKRYHVPIVSDDSLQDKRITLKIHEDDSLEKILEIISLTNKLKIMKNRQTGQITVYE
ncbi:FecR family protein [Ascidiimonas aurantiaca]|uniref:FecR family protein n=1 Tax=Ascidiimonas aurantiaca TaxID=1685432 RepID=UPI0030ECD271